MEKSSVELKSFDGKASDQDDVALIVVEPSSPGVFGAKRQWRILATIAAGVAGAIVLIIVLCVYYLVGFKKSTSSSTSTPSYELWCVGNCNFPAGSTSLNGGTPTSGVVLMGGGADVDDAFLWQIKNANGGNFLVLRTSGDDAYNPWVYNLSTFWGPKQGFPPLHSVSTILCNSREASYDPVVLGYVERASAVWFAGGDQLLYLSMWVATPLQEALQRKSAIATIGGTSAGLAILGNFIYDDVTDVSIKSHAAMTNPFDSRISIHPAFLKLPFLSNVLTDTHFVVRNRMGRMLTFLARIATNHTLSVPGQVIYGVGVDQTSALLLNATTGLVRIVGNTTAYICSSNGRMPQVCEPNKSLTFSNITCTRLSAADGDEFSFASFSSLRPTLFPGRIAGSGTRFCNNITNGAINPYHYGPDPEILVSYGYGYGYAMNTDVRAPEHC